MLLRVVVAYGREIYLLHGDKMEFYTIQLCKVCKKEVKIDAIVFLTEFINNVDNPVLCEECKKEKENG